MLSPPVPLLLILLGLISAASALARSIPLTSHRLQNATLLEQRHRHLLQHSPLYRLRWQARQELAATADFSNDTIPLTINNDYWARGLLLGELTVGTPPQRIVVEFNFWTNNFFVLNDGAYCDDCNSSSSSAGVGDGSSDSSSDGSSDESEEEVRRGARPIVLPNNSSSDSSESQPPAAAGRYNHNASSTFVDQKTVFYAFFGFVSGDMISEVVGFGDTFNVTLTIGEGYVFADQDYFGMSWLESLAVNGSVGLGLQSDKVGEDYPSTFDGILTQFREHTGMDASQKLISVYLSNQLAHYTATDPGYSDYEYDLETDFSGSLTFGAEDDLNCAAGTYTYHQLHSITFENPDMFLWAFNVSEVNTTSGMSSGPMNRIAWMDCGYSGEVSKQVFDVFANASGLSWHRNSTSGQGGVLDAEDCDVVLERAQNVTIYVKEGSSILLTPYDYLFKRSSDGLCQLNFVPYYNETANNFYYEYSGSHMTFSSSSEYVSPYEIQFDLYPLCLGQAFLNNHCYTLDLGRNMVGIAETRSSNLLFTEEEGS